VDLLGRALGAALPPVFSSSCSTRWATACGWHAIHRATRGCSKDPIFLRTAINTVIFIVVAINLKMGVALVLSGSRAEALGIACCR